MLTCAEIVPIMELYYYNMVPAPPMDVKWWWFFNCVGIV